MDSVVHHADVAIVGGGPAGQAAALVLAALDMRVVVLDEQPRPGGQILRQRPRAFDSKGWLRGRTYNGLKRRLRQFEERDDIVWLGGHVVLGVEMVGTGPTLLVGAPDGLVSVEARAILIATGAQDLAVPLPGWTLPGVLAAGGLQAMLKSQIIVPGARVVLAGTHPLQLLIASQLHEAGVEVAGVLFAQSREAMLGALFRHPIMAALSWPNLVLAARAYLSLGAARVPVRFDAHVTSIDGADCVVGVGVQHGGDTTHVACDVIGLCFGFVPQADLVRMAGVGVARAGHAGGWRALHDLWMFTGTPPFFVAGETAGLGGAAAAEAEGHLAGLGIARYLGVLTEQEAERQAGPLRGRQRRARGFAALLEAIADPRAVLAIDQPDDTVACRCEGITMGRLRAAVAPGRSADNIKLETRCGMGVCQGRNCEATLLRLMGEDAVDREPGFQARFPARPVAIADLLG